MKKIFIAILNIINFSFRVVRKEFSKGLMFPMTFDSGFDVKIIVKWKKFQRSFLKRKWQYIFFTYGLILTIFFGYQQYILHNIQAATYGFSQSDWSGGASTTVFAIHDNDQDLYDKYYSKDNNINTSIANQISLINASTTLIDASTSDFNTGSSTNNYLRINTDNNEIKMSLGYDATGVCGDFEVYHKDSGGYSALGPPSAASVCADLCPTCTLPTREEMICICQNKAIFGDNLGDGYYHSTTPASLVRGLNCSSIVLANYGAAYMVRCVRR